MEKDLKEAVKILRTLKQDAKLAISGFWDKSDDGFRCQIQLIDKFLSSIHNKKLKSKFKQTKLFKDE